MTYSSCSSFVTLSLQRTKHIYLIVLLLFLLNLIFYHLSFTLSSKLIFSLNHFHLTLFASRYLFSSLLIGFFLISYALNITASGIFISLFSALPFTLFLQCLGISLHFYFGWLLQARLISSLISFIIIILPVLSSV